MVTVAPEHFGDKVCQERNKVGCGCRPISQWKETDRNAYVLVKDLQGGQGAQVECYALSPGLLTP